MYQSASKETQFPQLFYMNIYNDLYYIKRAIITFVAIYFWDVAARQDQYMVFVTELLYWKKIILFS